MMCHQDMEADNFSKEYKEFAPKDQGLKLDGILSNRALDAKIKKMECKRTRTVVLRTLCGCEQVVKVLCDATSLRIVYLSSDVVQKGRIFQQSVDDPDLFVEKESTEAGKKYADSAEQRCIMLERRLAWIEGQIRAIFQTD